MKDIEFYKRAVSDPAFRRAKLEDLRYYKQVGAGLMWFCVIAGVAFSLYGGFTDGKWSLGIELLVVAALTGSTYSLCATRFAALQVLDQEKA